MLRCASKMSVAVSRRPSQTLARSPHTTPTTHHIIACSSGGGGGNVSGMLEQRDRQRGGKYYDIIEIVGHNPYRRELAIDRHYTTEKE